MFEMTRLILLTRILKKIKGFGNIEMTRDSQRQLATLTALLILL